MSSFACVTNVHYDPKRDILVGKNSSGGEVVFQTLEMYQTYAKSVGNLCPSHSYSPFEGDLLGRPETTAGTGFLEFKGRDQQTQLKYDAMSPFWHGDLRTTKAVDAGLFVSSQIMVERKPESTFNKVSDKK